MKFLMVCTDNLSLSPMAESMTNHYCNRHNYIFEADSAGVHVRLSGERPSPLAVQIMKSHGIDISTHRARQFTQLDFKEFHQIVTIGPAIHGKVLRLARTNKELKMVRDISEYMKSPLPELTETSADDFYQLLNDACEKVIFKIVAVR